MGEKRRNGRITTVSLEDEIAHLRGLDLKGLRARWQGVFRRQPPPHLPRHLLFGILAYQIQADRLGDLDHETDILEGASCQALVRLVGDVVKSRVEEMDHEAKALPSASDYAASSS